MAITNRKKGNLVEASIGSKVVGDVKKSISPQPEPIETKSTTKQTKKKGFLGTTVEELRKVNWPSFQYTVRWSLVIVLFTIVMAIGLGFFDHLFTSGISFVDCFSPNGRNQLINECSSALGDQILDFPR